MQGRSLCPWWANSQRKLAVVVRVSRGGSVAFFLLRVLVCDALCGQELVFFCYCVWMGPLQSFVSAVNAVNVVLQGKCVAHTETKFLYQLPGESCGACFASWWHCGASEVVVPNIEIFMAEMVRALG